MRYSKYMRFLILLLVLNISCATSALKDFDSVEPGMDRDNVLELIGSPIRANKNNAKKIWTYRFFTEEGEKVYKEVHFERDEVVYVGEAIDRSVVLKNDPQKIEEDRIDYESEKKAIQDYKRKKQETLEEALLREAKKRRKTFKPVE